MIDEDPVKWKATRVDIYCSQKVFDFFSAEDDRANIDFGVDKKDVVLSTKMSTL